MTWFMGLILVVPTSWNKAFQTVPSLVVFILAEVQIRHHNEGFPDTQISLSPPTSLNIGLSPLVLSSEHSSLSGGILLICLVAFLTWTVRFFEGR